MPTLYLAMFRRRFASFIPISTMDPRKMWIVEKSLEGCHSEFTPENMPGPKEGSLPTITFQGLSLLNFEGVSVYPFLWIFQLWISF